MLIPLTRPYPSLIPNSTTWTMAFQHQNISTQLQMLGHELNPSTMWIFKSRPSRAMMNSFHSSKHLHISATPCERHGFWLSGIFSTTNATFWLLELEVCVPPISHFRLLIYLRFSSGNVQYVEHCSQRHFPPNDISIVGMGLMMATIWIHLGTSTNKINDRLSVLYVFVLTIRLDISELLPSFYSVAFLGFMSVAGIPAFLEAWVLILDFISHTHSIHFQERAVFVRERANGLYGPGAYILANTISLTPFLFFCTVLFAVISYVPLSRFNSGSNYDSSDLDTGQSGFTLAP